MWNAVVIIGIKSLSRVSDAVIARGGRRLGARDVGGGGSM